MAKQTPSSGVRKDSPSALRRWAERPVIIESRIRPLVNALNATGLVTTFSSCEGHFDDTNPETCADRDHASVRFELNEGVTERRLEELFGHVIGRHVHSPLMWYALLSISKQYIPGEEDDYVAQHVFAFEIRPFNPHESLDLKREHVDRVIRHTARSVREFLKKKGSAAPAPRPSSSQKRRKRMKATG